MTYRRRANSDFERNTGRIRLTSGTTKLTSIPLSDTGDRGLLLRWFFPQSPASAPVRYAFALACCVGAFASRLLLDPLLHENAILLLFILAVVASGLKGGFGPGLLATFLGAFGVVYFLPPKFTFFTIAPGYLPDVARELTAFLFVGVFLSWISGALRDLRWEAIGLATQRNDILESITDGFGALDANGRFVYLNRAAAAQLMQRPREQAIGKSLWEEVPALRGSSVENLFSQVLDKHQAVHFEYQFPLSNRWFEIHAHPAQNSGLTVYFRDVSDRKLVELRLRQTLAERDAALDRVRVLSGLLPICAACKKIRDDDGNWHQIESYISEHSQAKFSHGMCPACGKQYYGELWPEA